MKIALAQINYTVGAIKDNKFKIIKSIYKAKEQGADLVVFAEHAISGTNCYDLINKMPFLESCEVALVEIASHCEGISVIVGLPILDGRRKVSSAVIIQDGRVVRYIGKEHVLSRNEKMFFDRSTGSDFIKVNGEKVAIFVGEDLLFDQKTGDNTDTVISIYADPYAQGVIDQRYDYLKTYSFLKQKSIIFVNHLGGQSDVVYDGSSCAFRNGDPLVYLDNFEEDFRIIDTVNDTPVEEKFTDKIENIYNAIRLGLGDYFRKNGFTKACLGLSGGIDSAVVLAMAVEVLGPENVRVLMLPSQFSSDHSVDDSIEMAENLGVGYDVIPITEAYDAIMDSMKPVIGGTAFDVTEENLQSRIRCDMLMALSNKFGYVLLNTSNKSEASVGYGTLYGDTSGSLGIIGDLYKTEVYELARFINRRMRIIPENIITKEPSAELRHGQKDSDSLPPYNVLDAILFRFIDKKQEVEEVLNAGFEEEMVYRVVELIKKYEFKRRQSCPALRLSERPYGSGFVLPLHTKYILYPHEMSPDKN